MERVLAALVLSLPISAYAADPASCKPIEDDAARLACYDQALGRNGGEPPGTRPSVDRASVSTPPLSAEEGASSERDFGAEALHKDSGKPDKPDAIRAHIVGTFEGWEPKTRFVLDNGQVWLCVDDHSVYYKATVSPEVTIERGLFGAYYLGIKELNSRARVKRIK